MVQRQQPLAMKRVCIGAQFLHGLPHLECRGARWHWPTEADGYSAGESSGPPPMELATFKTDDVPPYVIKMHGYEGHVQAFQDASEAAAEWLRLARPGFRLEDADYFTGSNCLRGG